MGTRERGVSGYRWYLGSAALGTIAHLVLPEPLSRFTYVASSVCTLLPLGLLLSRQARGDRRPWLLLMVAMTVMSVGEILNKFGGPDLRTFAEPLNSLAHVVILAAAIVLAWRRGSNDVGGMLDVSVGAIGVGSLVWTALLLPRLRAMDAAPGAQLALLVSVLVLLGVLGALTRIWLVTDCRLPALTMLVSTLLIALVGNVILAVSVGSATVDRPRWIEASFTISFALVGAAALHPSVHELSKPGSAPEDRLSTGRLVFLGAAMVVSPVVGGVREMLGLSSDGPLLALGSLLVAPLVMVRVGRLAHQRQQAEAALQHQATHDTLTGLPNRAELLTRLDAALRRERDAGARAVVLLFCDLNGFKDVNDRLGHQVGDELLVQVAGRIRPRLRAGDTLARYGGDEFLVLCEDQAQEQAVFRLLDHISRSLAEPFELAGEQVRISCSIGAVTSDGGSTGDDLIQRADQEMYRAKQRDRVGLPR